MPASDGGPTKGGCTMPKLLLVDDERDLLDALRTLFILEGYEVEAKEAADEALASLLASPKNKPDLIISDVIMPRMSGVEFLEKLRQHPDYTRVPFLFVSATVVPEEEAQIARIRTVRFLRKPFVVEDLCDLVREMVEARG